MAHDIKLKVCGMRDAQNIRAVAGVHPDYMGFIFFDRSPRFVGDDFQIPDDFPGTVKKVGVFVNAATDDILDKVQKHSLDFVQLHGRETPAQCEALKSRKVGVIKMFAVDEQTDFALTQHYQAAVDFFLFDTKGEYHGGNARRFDWRILSRYDQQIPFFLSGGISPAHMQEVLALTGYNLHAIDVNSGVEMGPAAKDVQKIETIQEILKNSKL